MKFQLLGLTALSQSVVGILYGKGREHLVAITINPHDGIERKKHSNNVRAELRGSLRRVGDAKELTLKGKFNDEAAKDMRASIDMPAFADDTINLLMAEDKVPPVVILDCVDRACFWASLRALEIPEKTMLKLAELSAYTPQKKNETADKPLGNAHKLLQLLKKRGTNPDTIALIEAAEKFRLPDLDWPLQVKARDFAHELWVAQSLTRHWHVRKAIGLSMDGMAFVNRIFNRIGGFNLPKSQDSIMDAQKRLVDRANHYKSQVTNENLEARPHEYVPVRTKEEAQKAIKERFLKEWGLKSMEEAEKVDFGEVYMYLDSLMVPRLRIRDGWHFLPFDKCLFEFDTFNDEITQRDRTYVVAENKFNHKAIAMHIYRQKSDGTLGYAGLDITVHLRGRRFRSISVTEHNTGKTVYGTNLATSLHLIMVAHCLSAITRIHAPGYEDKIVTPPKNRVKVGKHAYPYFEYHDVAIDGTTVDYLLVGKSGAVSGITKRRHIVRGHPRRQLNREGNITDISFIPPHMRGNARLGFVAHGSVVR